jgi:hypothetical protein
MLPELDTGDLKYVRPIFKTNFLEEFVNPQIYCFLSLYAVFRRLPCVQISDGHNLAVESFCVLTALHVIDPPPDVFASANRRSAFSPTLLLDNG